MAARRFQTWGEMVDIQEKLATAWPTEVEIQPDPEKVLECLALMELI